MIAWHQVASARKVDLIRDKRQVDLTSSLSDYEVVVPVKVDSRGEPILHRVQRRSADSDDSDGDDARVHYRLRLANQEVHVELEPNGRLVSPGLVVERRGGKKKKTSRRISPDAALCHFHGRLRNHSDSAAALSTCDNGLRGVIRINSEDYLIEPLKGHNTSEQHHPHLVYKRSALPENNLLQGTCGNREFRLASADREKWEEEQQEAARSKKRRSSRRKKRSVSSERNVETLVVADKMMMEYYSNEDIETYILTVMNMVSSLYRDASIGNAINIVLVRIMLLESEEHEIQEDLSINHHADNTLKSFCKWQRYINPKDENHPNHHDVAILLTRYNICTRMNEPCSTLGLAEVAGMCQPQRSCNVNEDTGLALAFTIAHEMGHNFGMSHDGPHNGCQAPYGERQHVMSPHLNSDTSPLVWSNCSRQEITKFLDRDWGRCLDDEPSDHEFSFPEVPPGAMYDADHQCRLQYGPGATYCHGIEDVCLTLWCRLKNKCVTRLEPAAPGTQCGKNKWCFMGQCTLVGERPEAIDGEWGPWSEWSSCTRTCGAGITMGERRCDNPPPANGGRYCIGDRKRYKLCNTQACPEGVSSFRSVQCAKHNNIPYKDELLSWLPVSTPVTPCQLHCKPEGKFFSVMMSDSVIDGTPCNPGTRDVCINGKCRKVSCDWGIDSEAQEDRCGICHGDGTTCQTVRGEYNHESGVGYIEALVIPKGSRNIRVEEVEDVSNYIAVRGETGEYFLNGNWLIQWTGEYPAGGSTLYYRREGEKETVHIPGPSAENLSIMILYQTANPGLTYEYTIPIGNVTRKPEFHWEYTDWSVCTETCGGGIQISTARCMEKEAGLVEDTFCNATGKLLEITRVCNKHQCPARWWSGPWQHCSVTCGANGVRKRTVLCVRSFGKDEQLALDDKECAQHPKPAEAEACTHKVPCPGDIYWETGDWSETCHGDPCNNQTRRVWCTIEGDSCQTKEKPPSFRQCGNLTCGVWVIGNWSECSQSCGGGVQFRRVTCEGGLKCPDTSEPESIRLCNKPCKTNSPVLEDNAASGLKSVPPTRQSLAARKEISSSEYRTEKGKNVLLVNEGEGSGNADTHYVVSIDSAEQGKNRRRHHNHHDHKRWHYNTGDAKTHRKNKKKDDGNKERRSQEVVEDKIDPEDFQVIAIENQPSHKDQYQVLSDRWFQEGVDILDYKSQIAASSQDEQQLGLGEEESKETGTKHALDIKPHFEWKIGDWNKCSRQCNGGHQSREIMCFEVTTQTLVDPDLCDLHSRPLYMETCNLEPCVEWQLSEWSQCSTMCGEGTKRRTVECPQPEKCNLESKPKEEMQCNVRPCVDWVAGPWSQCPVTCGGGHQVRHVKCVNHTSQEPATKCNLGSKPVHRQVCNVEDCPESNSAKFTTCLDKLDSKLCISLKHMCETWYFKVKCCHTCSKRTHRTNT